MANFASSVLETGQAIFKRDYLSKGEWRTNDWLAVQKVMKGGIADPALVALRTSVSRTVTAMLPIRTAEGSDTTISHNHTGSAGDSTAVTPTWSAISEKFQTSLKRSNNNVFNAAEMFASTLNDKIRNILTRSNKALVAAMIADRTAICEDGANGTFEGTTNDIYELPATYKTDFYSELRSVSNANEYFDNIMVLADTKAFQLAKKAGAQGSSNAENQAWQLDGLDIVPTNSDVLGAIKTLNGSVLFAPMNGLSYIPWIPIQNRVKTLAQLNVEQSVGDFASIAIPEIGVNIGVHAYSAGADTSSAGGATQDRITYYQVFVYWAYNSSPLSTRRGASDSVVIGMGLLP
ncbi:hypothetical protein KAR91_38985 [Candidatus Pacearchaeota archaeon]|nr:hypothetical protein [Candidatus Pacearchaeota archaeon]